MILLPLTLRVRYPPSHNPLFTIVDAYEEFRPIRDIKLLTVSIDQRDQYISVQTEMMFRNGTMSHAMSGYGFSLESACTASVAHALGEYARLRS